MNSLIFDQEFVDDIYPVSPKDYTRFSARGVVFNADNKVAILHIRGKDYFGYRDHYELPGGGIEKQENPLDAFRREMQEEIGIVTKEEQQIATIRYHFNTLRRYDVSYIFIAKVDRYCDVHYTQQELALIEKIEWFDLDDLVERLSSNCVENVGILIHRRDLWIVQQARKVLHL